MPRRGKRQRDESSKGIDSKEMISEIEQRVPERQLPSKMPVNNVNNIPTVALSNQHLSYLNAGKQLHELFNVATRCVSQASKFLDFAGISRTNGIDTSAGASHMPGVLADGLASLVLAEIRDIFQPKSVPETQEAIICNHLNQLCQRVNVGMNQMINLLVSFASYVDVELAKVGLAEAIGSIRNRINIKLALRGLVTNAPGGSLAYSQQPLNIKSDPAIANINSPNFVSGQNQNMNPLLLFHGNVASPQGYYYPMNTHYLQPNSPYASEKKFVPNVPYCNVPMVPDPSKIPSYGHNANMQVVQHPKAEKEGVYRAASVTKRNMAFLFGDLNLKPFPLYKKRKVGSAVHPGLSEIPNGVRLTRMEICHKNIEGGYIEKTIRQFEDYVEAINYKHGARFVLYFAEG